MRNLAASTAPLANTLFEYAVCENVITSSSPAKITSCSPTIVPPLTEEKPISFLGLGIPVPAPEWGAMLSESRNYIRDHGYLTIFPGLAIMITVLAFNLMGDGLRDALDPRMRK